MKIYFHPCIEEFTNSYVVVNDNPSVMEAIIIDPGKITNNLIMQIENGGYKLTGVLITHNHENHVKGLKTLTKIYSPYIYAADYEVEENKAVVLNGDGKLIVAGLEIEYYSIPGHSSDSMIYKIGSVIFTGDTLLAGTIGETSSHYAKRLLISNISKKILSQTEDTVLMPGHGPPTTVATEKMYNLDLIKTDIDHQDSVSYK